MPTTTNFGWTTPADTDLVKDGALAIRTLGNGIDTSFLDLKGGTTGQNLRKATNTDLDFTWAGDATNTVIDAEGDLLVGDSADTLQRLALGTNGQVLTVDTTVDGKIKWATPATGGGGKVLQVVSTTYSTQTSSTSTTPSDTGLSLSITPSAATSKVLVLVYQPTAVTRTTTSLGGGIRLLRGATDLTGNSPYSFFTILGLTNQYNEMYGIYNLSWLDSPNTTSSTTYKTQQRVENANNTPSIVTQIASNTSSMILMEIGA